MVVVSWFHRACIGGFCLAASLTLTSALWRGTGWFFAIPGLALCITAVAAFRGAAIRFDVDHLIVKTTWRTRRVPKQDVEGFGTTLGSNAAGRPWRVPYVKSVSGPLIANEEIRSLRSGTVVDRVVAIGDVWLGSR